MTNITPCRSFKEQICWDVLEAAKDAGDTHVANACRRLITACRRGWKRHRDPNDWALVREFHEMLRDARAEERGA